MLFGPGKGLEKMASRDILGTRRGEHQDGPVWSPTWLLTMQPRTVI